MVLRSLCIAAVLGSSILLAKSAPSNSTASAFELRATLPIVFLNTVSAAKSHAGDPVFAKTTQNVRLADGKIVPAGTKVAGHILAANAFVYDHTPYARQKASELSIHFDSLTLNGESMPLQVTVRAMADSLASWRAREPGPADMDPTETVTQIGGDQLSRWQAEVRNMDGDVVAYNKKSGVYAHLIASGRCDSSNVEASVDIYSASACGLYGFTNVSASEVGDTANPSTLTLVSTRTSPEIWKHSTALLEVLGN